MQIPAKKINILLAFLIVGSSSWAQSPAQPAQAPAPEAAAPQPATPANGTPATAAPGAPAKPSTDNTGGGAATSSALDYLYNHKPQEGSVADQASQANEEAKNRAMAADALGLGSKISDPQVRARFERYLSMKEVPQAELAAYAAEVQKINQLLRSNQPFLAWRELQVLGSYQDIDAGVSYELANRIESIWNTDKASNHIDNENQQLKQQVKQADNNADLMSDSIRQGDLTYQKQGEKGGGRNRGNADAGGGGAPANPGGEGGGAASSTVPNLPSMPNTRGIEGRMQLTEEYLASLEGKARIKLNELKKEKLLDKTKADFAAYTKTLFDSGRQQHTMLAAEFYLKIFDEDEYPVEMGNEVDACLEMTKDVQSSVEVFRYKADKNQIAAATARLQDAFTLGENQPAVLALERTEKEKVEAFNTQLEKMENLLEARDFGPIPQEIENTKLIALDFDGTKATALVNAVKLESQLHLGKAKLAAQQQDLKTAMDEFQEAAKAWPDNPDLHDSSVAFFNSQDTKNQSTTEFDRLVGEGNLREIFDKQLLFATAVHGDAKREELLKGALEKIKGAEVAAEKANVMRNAGDVYGAWETVEIASKDLPNDNKLNALRAELAGKGAEFVEAISKAKDAETRGDLGFSLTWYAVAQRYYPASTMANDAIERLSKKLLGEEGKTNSL